MCAFAKKTPSPSPNPITTTALSLSLHRATITITSNSLFSLSVSFAFHSLSSLGPYVVDERESVEICEKTQHLSDFFLLLVKLSLHFFNEMIGVASVVVGFTFTIYASSLNKYTIAFFFCVPTSCAASCMHRSLCRSPPE